MLQKQGDRRLSQRKRLSRCTWGVQERGWYARWGRAQIRGSSREEVDFRHSVTEKGMLIVMHVNMWNVDIGSLYSQMFSATSLMNHKFTIYRPF